MPGDASGSDQDPHYPLKSSGWSRGPATYINFHFIVYCFQIGALQVQAWAGHDLRRSKMPWE